MAELYNRRDFKTSDGHMQVFVGLEMCTLIPDTHRIHDNADSANASIPPRRINVKEAAAGPLPIPEDIPDFAEALYEALRRQDGFGDRLSSVRFGRKSGESETAIPI